MNKSSTFVDELFGGRRADTVTVIVVALLAGALGAITNAITDQPMTQIAIYLIIFAAATAAIYLLGKRRRRPKEQFGGPPDIERIP